MNKNYLMRAIRFNYIVHIVQLKTYGML